MKAKAKSPANIAFIKFWGKKDSRLNLPVNDSISMNLSNCVTTTSVEFDAKYKTDIMQLNGKKITGTGLERVVRILDLVRKKAGFKLNGLVASENNFPTSAGIASSASAFSALAAAASKAAGLDLNKKELSILARIGSGSACRSIDDGFTYWEEGISNETSYAYSIAKPDFWDISDIVTVVSNDAKKHSSTDGHNIAQTSPYFETRIKNIGERISQMKKAILNKDFLKFGNILEIEAVDLHVMAMTSNPPIFYWNEGTVQIMRNLMEWREQGLYAYFTMDAGANVHVLCQGKDENEVNKRLKQLSLVKFTIVNKPAIGTRLV